eukprot:9473429-Pyramimonas_sp.AAC.1
MLAATGEEEVEVHGLVKFEKAPETATSPHPQTICGNEPADRAVPPIRIGKHNRKQTSICPGSRP